MRPQIEKQIHAEKNLGRYDKELFSKLLRGALSSIPTWRRCSRRIWTGRLAELSPVEFSVLLLGAFELSQHTRGALQSRDQ